MGLTWDQVKMNKEKDRCKFTGSASSLHQTSIYCCPGLQSFKGSKGPGGGGDIAVTQNEMILEEKKGRVYLPPSPQ